MFRLTYRPLWRAKIATIIAIGFVLRLAVALASDQIYQADEVFSYLEQAHRLVFGYGIIPWEYRYGVRSWIVPGILSGLLQTFHYFHIDDPNVYVVLIKVVFCIASLSLIGSAYIIVRSLASESAAALAAMLVATWYELIYFASKPTPEVLAMYCLAGALAVACVTPNGKRAILCGFLCGVAAVLRFQYVPACALIAILAVFLWRKSGKGKRSDLPFLGFGGALAIAIAGCVDYFTWGGFLVSYYNSFVYQTVYGVADVFGVVPFWFYYAALLIGSSGLFLITIALALLPAMLGKTWILLLCILSIIMPHALVSHKEYRFIIAAVPFMVMLAAIVVSDLAARVSVWSWPTRRGFVYAATGVFVVMSAAGLLLRLPYESSLYGHDGTLTRANLFERSGILSAYLYLHNEPDVAAISETYAQWYLTGGYYYLHKDVPIYLPAQLSKVVPKADYGRYVSHIICNHSDGPIPGFVTIATFGDVDVRKSIISERPYLALNFDNIHPYQPGVDNRFHSTYNTDVAFGRQK